MNQERLDAIELLGALPRPVQDELRRSITTRSYARNQVLFHQGAPSDEMYGVVSGAVAVVSRSTDGREAVVAVLDHGALFGELGLFDGGDRATDVRALEDTTVVVLPYAAMRAVLEERPELLWTIVRMLATRLRATDESLSDAVFLDVPARTAKRLLELAGDSDDVRLGMTQEDLAGLVGASRERVNKALSLFVRLGWLSANGRGRYRVDDRAALEDRAAQ